MNLKQTTFKQDLMIALWAYSANNVSLLSNFSEL